MIANKCPIIFSEEECKDIWNKKKCEKTLRKGRCDKSNSQANCRKTCGICTPEPAPAACPDKGILNINIILSTNVNRNH